MKGSKISAILVIAVGQAGKPYMLDWATIDGDGGTSSGEPYLLSGTMAHLDAGRRGGGPYELPGGFWAAGSLCAVDFCHYARFADHRLRAD